MRHLVLALMIALLPVRGWMGDAMALAMVAAPAQAMSQALQADAPPCPDHAVTRDADGQHAKGDGDHAHKSCDVCNVPAMAISLPAAAGLAPVQGLLAPSAERFASSEPHRGTKPPIS